MEIPDSFFFSWMYWQLSLYIKEKEGKVPTWEGNKRASSCVVVHCIAANLEIILFQEDDNIEKSGGKDAKDAIWPLS